MQGEEKAPAERTNFVLQAGGAVVFVASTAQEREINMFGKGAGMVRSQQLQNSSEVIGEKPWTDMVK